MDLKDYREQPDNGLFEKIERRLQHRRLMRRAGVAAGVVAVVAVVAVTLWPAGEANETIVASRVALQQPAVQPQSVADIDSVDTVAPAAVTQHKSVNWNQQNPDRIAPAVAAKEASDDAVTETRTLSIPQTQASQVDAVELNTVYEAPRKVVSEQPKTQPKQTVAVPDTVYHSSVPVKNDPAVEPVPHEDNLFWVPNIIVPAGDVEENRTFTMKFTSTVTQFQITIYNRGGRQVFHSTDPAFVWDGTSKGSAMSQGAYIWLAKFRDSSGKLHEEHGTVTLIR